MLKTECSTEITLYQGKITVTFTLTVQSDRTGRPISTCRERQAKVNALLDTPAQAHILILISTLNSQPHKARGAVYNNDHATRRSQEDVDKTRNVGTSPVEWVEFELK